MIHLLEINKTHNGMYVEKLNLFSTGFNTNDKYILDSNDFIGRSNEKNSTYNS